MAYQCPRCGGAVQRGSSTAAGVAGGVVGMLLFAAFSSFQCPQCGPIPKSEFPPSVRAEMTAGSLAMLGVAALLFVGVLYLLTVLHS
jgi:predicted RNA-binding Zn-ribbon protein involved in translation (DUF1610 family)